MKLETLTRHELNSTSVKRLQNPHLLPILGESSVINKTYLFEMPVEYYLGDNEGIAYFHEIPKPHL